MGGLNRDLVLGYYQSRDNGQYIQMRQFCVLFNGAVFTTGWIENDVNDFDRKGRGWFPVLKRAPEALRGAIYIGKYPTPHAILAAAAAPAKRAAG